MRTLSRRRFRQFCREHPDAAEALTNWWNAVQRLGWSGFSDVRTTFNSASYVDPLVVFNITGNRYRLVTWIDYERGFVVLKWFGSHAAYDRGEWRE